IAIFMTQDFSGGMRTESANANFNGGIPDIMLGKAGQNADAIQQRKRRRRHLLHRFLKLWGGLVGRSDQLRIPEAEIIPTAVCLALDLFGEKIHHHGSGQRTVWWLFVLIFDSRNISQFPNIASIL